VLLVEEEERLGRRTNTVLITTANGSVPLDTGFLVHNGRTRPLLVRLFGERRSMVLQLPRHACNHLHRWRGDGEHPVPTG
jgi:hypothetical protein